MKPFDDEPGREGAVMAVFSRRCRDGAKGGGSALCLSHISPEGVRLIILSFFEGGTPRGGTSIRDGKEPPPGWPRAGAPYRL